MDLDPPPSVARKGGKRSITGGGKQRRKRVRRISSSDDDMDDPMDDDMEILSNLPPDSELISNSSTPCVSKFFHHFHFIYIYLNYFFSLCKCLFTTLKENVF